MTFEYRSECEQLAQRLAQATQLIEQSNDDLVLLINAIAIDLRKLDEPKCLNQKVADAWALHGTKLKSFLANLEANGLKIVAK